MFILPQMDLFPLAPTVIGEPEDRLQPGQSPPAVTPAEAPETLGDTGIEPLQTRGAACGECPALEIDAHIERRIVFDYGRKWPAVAVVAFDQMKKQIT
ncbi:MAG: hypothetical protein ACR2M4_03585 [Actinomycetota bacterium]